LKVLEKAIKGEEKETKEENVELDAVMQLARQKAESYSKKLSRRNR